MDKAKRVPDCGGEGSEHRPDRLLDLLDVVGDANFVIPQVRGWSTLLHPSQAALKNMAECDTNINLNMSASAKETMVARLSKSVNAWRMQPTQWHPALIFKSC